MPIVAAVLALAAIVWGAVYARRGSLVVGCAVFVLVGYVLGHEFWSAKVGPLPLTLERFLLAALVATLIVQWRMGKLQLRRWTTSDWAVFALLAMFAASAALSSQPDASDGVTSKWGRLVSSFLVPALLYGIARQADLSSRDWSRLLVVFTLLGVYLACTGLLEIAGAWSFVFPRYIADPTLGIHFGRARGPELNAASLGLYLTACFWCASALLGQATRRWNQLAVAVSMPLMAVGVLLTYTRSTWLGLAASGAVVTSLIIPHRWRVATLSAAAAMGALVLIVSWSQLAGLQREGTAAESLHSVDQRTSFAYVSWQMLCDHPVFGVGFGRFYDRKLPYLSDRSQDFELDSIRPLHHHNTLLSVLTETGIVGFAIFTALFVIWGRIAWQLAHDGDSPRWVRACGVLTLALLTSYLSSAVFHDLTLIASQQWLVFLFAGMAVTLRQKAFARSVVATGPDHKDTAYVAQPGKPAMAHANIDLFGMSISRLTMQQTVERLLTWCAEPCSGSCRYVLTPNVDHAVLFQDRDDLRAAYGGASLVLADGAPIVLASRILGRPLPERVAGSDLVPSLLTAVKRPLGVFLLGAAPGVADDAARQIARRWPRVRVLGTYSPPPGFKNLESENDRILAAVAATAPDLLIVGLGAPKQELWVHRNQHRLQTKVAICAGATIDFLAGHRRRSPVWMRRAGLEWLHRMCSEPRRLTARYARDAWVFPQLVWREWRGI